MFNVGDKIVHPMHGAGTVSAIKEQNIGDVKETYYIISMPNEVKVMVPIEKAEELGVRNIIPEKEVSKVLSVLEKDEIQQATSNWNKRYKENIDRMKTGNIYEVASVVRDLSFRQIENGLCTGEKKMLFSAKQILVSELVLAEHCSKEEMEQLVDKKISRSFKINRLQNENNLIGKNIVSKFIPFEGISTV